MSAKANRRVGRRVNRRAPGRAPGFRWGRVRVVMGFLLLLLIAVVGRATQIHVVEQARYVEAATRNARGTMVIRTRRAEITTRTPEGNARGVTLATSLQARALVANPREVRDPRAAAELLSPLIEMPVDRIEAILSVDHRFAYVAHQLTGSVVDELSSLLRGPTTRAVLRGLRLDPDYKRYYPKGPLAGQLLGYVFWVDHSGYTGLERGLDKEFDAWVHGGSHRLKALRTGRISKGSGRLALFENIAPLLDAGPPTVETTLDATLQDRTERLVADAVARSFARRGLAIIYDVHSGEILAFAHVPQVDPNRWRQSSPRSRAPWGITGAYELGSVMKVFTVAKAIDAGVVTPETEIDTKGGRWRLANVTIKDLHRMKSATVRDILRYSSNIGTAQIAMLAGPKALAEVLEAAGFGKTTGLPIPNEAAGLFNRDYAHWHPVRFANLAFGQGIGVTPIQLVRAFAALGNDGILLKPHLIRSVRAYNGDYLYRAEPEPLGRVVSAETAAIMRDLLMSVVSPGATGARARVEGCPVGGKTGTGQQWVIDPETGKGHYSANDEIASFVGFLPGDRPRYAIYVLIDRPIGLGGGAIAAPTFAKIANMILETQGGRPCGGSVARKAHFRRRVPQAPPVPARARPETGASALAADPVGGGVMVPDLVGQTLPEVIEGLARRHLRPQIQGAGLVISQDPPAGTLTEPGAAVQVVCSLSIRSGGFDAPE